MSSAADSAFSDVSLALRNDPDDDVTVDGNVLLVHGTPFASLDRDALIVDLPGSRAADLVERGMASLVEETATTVGVRVAVGDTENWLELATEAHQFVGEPPVGRQS